MYHLHINIGDVLCIRLKLSMYTLNVYYDLRYYTSFITTKLMDFGNRQGKCAIFNPNYVILLIV